MVYPKPLNKKTIERMCRESGLTEREREFLSGLFEGAASLYGIIQLKDLWKVYKELSGKTETPKIQRKDIYAISSILRREELDYRIYEIDELYTREKRDDKERFIVSRDILAGPRLDIFYKLLHQQCDKPFYVPDNLVSIKGRVTGEEETELKNYLDNLVSNSDVIPEYSPGEDKTIPSPYKGKKLSEIIHMSRHDRIMIKILTRDVSIGKKGAEKELEEYKENVEKPYSSRIMKSICFDAFTGRLNPREQIEDLMENLISVGVAMSLDEANHLLQLVSAFTNNSRLYINRGWTPVELNRMRMEANPGPLRIHIGEGIREAIRNGEISLEELREGLERQGLDVEFEFNN